MTSSPFRRLFSSMKVEQLVGGDETHAAFAATSERYPRTRRWQRDRNTPGTSIGVHAAGDSIAVANADSHEIGVARSA